MTVAVEVEGAVMVVTIDRPEVRNAVDRPTAEALYRAFSRFDSDSEVSVAVLTGAGGTFCAGADLRAIGEERGNRVESRPPERIVGSPGPMGPTRMVLSKPVIAAVEGHAVAGGLELALWCDLRVVAEDAVLGVYCRRWGVPLVDGGNVRLPRLIGHGRAMDMILTGRPVEGPEALRIGLASRLTPPGGARAAALDLAHRLAAFPQRCLRSDRLVAIGQWDMSLAEALAEETRSGLEVIASGETGEGARRFAGGEGRHGVFDR